MRLEVGGRVVELNELGYLVNPDDWSEEVAEKLAELEGLKLYDECWGLIGYFREFYAENKRLPTMRELVMTLGKQHGEHFHDREKYKEFIYKLFPYCPIGTIARLAGLPMPEPGDGYT